MSSTILLSDNGATSGISGYQLTGGTDGTLTIQTTTSGGTPTTAVSIDNTQNTTVAGNLTLSGSGKRITGDFSNATVANRVAFQTSTVNGSTGVGSIPNGAGTQASFVAFAYPDTTNSQSIVMRASNTEGAVDIISNTAGTASYYPMRFYTGGSERMRVDTSGYVGIGGANDAAYGKLEVLGTGYQAMAVKSTDASGVILALAANSSGESRINTVSNHPMAFYTNNAERMRIDSSGNVGIGTSSPSTFGKLVEYSYDNSNATVSSASSIALVNSQGSYSGKGSVIKFFNDVNAANNYTSAIGGSLESSNSTGATGYLSFYTKGALTDTVPTERMRIDASGNLLVGYTTKGSTSINKLVAANAYVCKAGADAALGGNVFNINWTGSAQIWIDGTNIGTVTVTSDYRIKQKVETQITPALERVMQLRPVTYELKDYGTLYKADGVAREGFIAHELQAVIPSAVEGEKDAEDQIQSLKLDALCSVLTKAIQEQQAIITQQAEAIASLQADVAALKGK